MYEFESVYTKQKDGYDCTTSFYGCVTGSDMLGAEKAFATLQAQYKKISYKEVRRWGKQAIMSAAAIGENDLDVNWITAASNYLLKLQNKRSDMALKVTVISYKSKSKVLGEKDISKMTKSNETVIVLQPGNSSQNNLPKADAFEIHIDTVRATKEKDDGIIEKTRQLIKSYVTCPDHNCDVKRLVGIGVRG